jgi:hypothetical protein
MLSEQMRSIDLEEQALLTMRYLASQVSRRPLMFGLVQKDVERWQDMSAEERKAALKRNVRRVGSVCPWVRSKDRVMHVLESYGRA